MVKLGAVRRILLIQLAVTLTVALVILFFNSKLAAISAVLGGAIGFSGSWLYARKMFAPQGSEIKKIVRSHYIAEAYKLTFTILLFSLVFIKFKEVHAPSLFGAYVATLSVYWIALLIDKKN